MAAEYSLLAGLEASPNPNPCAHAIIASKQGGRDYCGIRSVLALTSSGIRLVSSEAFSHCAGRMAQTGYSREPAPRSRKERVTNA